MMAAKIPREITYKLVKALEVAANDPEVKTFYIERSAVPFYLPREKSIDYINEKRILLRKVMDKAGILKEK